jgi:hypothetical protein
MASYEPLPLLEEYFLLDYLRSRSTSTMGFLTSIVDWNGPLPDDTWGMFTSGITALLSDSSHQSLSVIRTVSILVHAINCLLMFHVMKYALAAPEDDNSNFTTWLAGGSTLIFSIYPLVPEAVSFIGGLAYEFGTTFFLTAFFLYMKGKQERNWTILGLSWISFLFAVLSDNSLWSSGFIMVALELSISFIGTPPPPSNREVPTADQVFEDAVDRLLEESKLHQADERADTAAGATAEQNQSNGNPPRVYDEDNDPDNLFETLVPCLPLIVLGVLLSIRALPSTGNEQLPGDMIGGFSDWGRIFKNLFFPINQSVTTDYSTAYSQLFCFYAIPVLVSVVALIRSRQFRRNAAFLFAWLIVIVVPHLHTAIGESFMTGSRLAYSALVPASAMIALFLFSPGFAVAKLALAKKTNTKKACLIFAAAFITLLSLINFNRSMQQAAAYAEGAKQLQKLSEQVNRKATETNAPYVLIRNIPKNVAISDRVDPSKVIIFDGKQKLLRATNVSDGFLKDALQQGHYRDQVMRWDESKNELTKIDFEVKAAQVKELSAAEINQRIEKENQNESVQFDSTTGEILIKSSSDDSPSIKIDATGFSQLGDDFVYIDCKIDLSNADPKKEMRLYWSNVDQQGFDNMRMISCATKTDDGQSHRYYFPIRSSAWTTNGSINQIALGFPKASRVVLTRMGMETVNNRIAKLTHVKTEKRPDAQTSHAPVHLRMLYNPPNLPELGLLSIDRKTDEATLKYDTSMIEDAHGVVIEIRRADSHLLQPNSDREDDNPLKTIAFENTVGEIKLPGKHFKTDGVYSLRVFATNKEGKLMGNASDQINCLIYTSPPGS